MFCVARELGRTRESRLNLSRAQHFVHDQEEHKSRSVGIGPVQMVPVNSSVSSESVKIVYATSRAFGNSSGIAPVG